MGDTLKPIRKLFTGGPAAFCCEKAGGINKPKLANNRNPFLCRQILLNMVAKFIKKYGTWTVLALVLSCCGKPEPKAEIRDLYTSLHQASKQNMDTSRLHALRKQYGVFFDYYTQEVLGLWTPSDSFTAARLDFFGKRNRFVFERINGAGAALEAQTRHLGKMLATWVEHFPSDSLPVIYRYYSQFSNYFTIAAPVEKGKIGLGYSVEMFLGDTFIGYKSLELPKWYGRFTRPELVPPMLAMAYLNYLYDSGSSREHMLGEMIYYGKLLYATSIIASWMEPYTIAGLSKEEWQWCLEEEANIWKHYLDARVLYSSNRMEYGRYFVEGNETKGSGIPEHCPPMIGRWTGYRIVEAFMKKNSNLSLKELMRLNNPEQILSESAYKPK